MAPNPASAVGTRPAPNPQPQIKVGAAAINLSSFVDEMLLIQDPLIDKEAAVKDLLELPSFMAAGWRRAAQLSPRARKAAGGRVQQAFQMAGENINKAKGKSYKSPTGGTVSTPLSRGERAAPKRRLVPKEKRPKGQTQGTFETIFGHPSPAPA
jgi:hypothetical protein